MKRTLIFLSFVLLANSVGAGQFPQQIISMSEAETMALDYSSDLKALKARKKYLFKMMDISLSPSRPQIFLEGDFKRISNVSEVNLPTGKTVSLGDNENYSIGPSLNWLLYDFGLTKSGHERARHLYLAKKSEALALKNKILLSTRLAYLNIKLSLDKAVLINESLNLAGKQYNDIKLRYEAGAADKLDKIAARQEVLMRKKEFRNARSEIALVVREFAYLTGFGKNLDLRFPANKKLVGMLSDTDEETTIVLNFDSIKKLKKLLEKSILKRPSDKNPSVKAFSELKKSYKSDRDALKAQRLPQLKLFAKASLDYPNGPSLETFNQNILGLNFKMPLFDGRRIKGNIQAKSFDIKYIKEKKTETFNIINLQWHKAKDRVEGLKVQSEINKEALENAEELALLTYNSYKAGRATFLKVEDANLKALNWKIESLETEIRILSQWALMNSLSSDGEK